MLNNPIKLLDKDGRKPDNYYRNQRGDLLAVVRTNDTQDNFYTVKNDNKVVLTHTREKDVTWNRATDQEKGKIVTRIEKAQRGGGQQVNGDGLNTDQQALAANFTTNSGSVAQNANTTPPTNNNGQPVQVFNGQAQNTTTGQVIVGAIYSHDSNGGGAGYRKVYNTDTVNPGGLPDAQVVPQGSLPTPTGVQEIELTGGLPINLTTRVANDRDTTDDVPITTSDGKVIPQ